MRSRTLILLLCGAIAACSEQSTPAAPQNGAQTITQKSSGAVVTRDDAGSLDARLMRAVFGPAYDAASRMAKVSLPDPDRRGKSALYFVQASAHTTLPDGVTVLAANALPPGDDGASAPDPSHATQGLLNVFFVKQQAGTWSVVRRHENVGAFGSHGNLGAIRWVTLAAGKPGLAIGNFYTGQGQTIDQLALFDLGDAGLAQLAAGIDLHSDNDGACEDDTAKCWNVDGKYSFVAPRKPGPYDDLLIVFSGQIEAGPENSVADRDNMTPVKRVTTPLRGQARYAFDGKRYTLVEGKNSVSEL